MAEPVPPPDDADLPPLQTPVVVEDAQGQQFDADATELDGLLRSGQFKLAPDQYQREGAGGVPVTIGGETRYLPADEANAAIRSFQGDATTGAAADQADLARSYDNPLDAARAASAGLLRTATLGASDQALVALRPDMADELQGLKTYKPGWTTAGEVTGMALPLLAGGAGALAGGARLAGAGVRGVAAGGELAGSLGARAAVGLGAAEGGVAARAVGAAARGAFEVGAFEAGQEVSAAALQKRELEAGKVAEAFGHGALVGAALMGGGSLAWSGGKAALGATMKAAGAVTEKAADAGATWLDVRGAAGPGGTAVQDLATVAERELSARGLGASAAQARELAAMAPEVRAKALDLAQGIALQSAEKKAAAAEALALRSGEQAAAAIEAASAAGARADVVALVRGAESELLPKLQAVSGPQAKAALREGGAWLDEIGSKAADGDLGALWKARGDLANELAQAKGPADGFKRELLARIDAAMEAAGGPGVQDALRAGEAARWVKEAAKSGALTAEREAGKTVQQVAGAVAAAGLSPTGMLAGAASVLVPKIVRTWGADAGAVVARAVREGNTAALSQITDKLVESSVGKYLAPAAASAKGAMPAATKAARQGVIKAEGEIAKRLFDPEPPKEAKREPGRPVQLAARPAAPKAAPGPSVRDLATKLETSKAEQRARYEQIARQTPALAPEAKGALAASDRVHDYLLSTLPTSPNQRQSLTPQAEKAYLSRAEQVEFATRVRVASDPLSCLDSLAAGTLSRVEVETLEATAPTVLASIRSAVQTQLDARTEPLPYRQALDLSLLLGVVGTPAMDPRTVAALQASYAPPPPAPQPSPPPSAPKRAISASRDWTLRREEM